jgi:hypothetical protein
MKCILRLLFRITGANSVQVISFATLRNFLNFIFATAVGIRHAHHVTSPYPQKLSLTSPTSVSRSVGIVRSRTKATELVS